MSAINPAESLYAAIALADRALAGMYAAGADRKAVATLAELVEDLKHQHDLLPDCIQENEGDHCPECEHGYRDLHPGCDSDQDPVWEWHCKARRVWQCPIVRACGFRDPSDPMGDVPGFLRQAG